MTDRPATPAEAAAVAATLHAPPPSRLQLVSAAGIVPVRTEFLFGGRIPRGALSIVCGIGGLGKSTATGAYLAAQVTNGLAADDVGPGRVLISSAEDDPAATLVPRLMAADANLDLVDFIQPAEDAGFMGLTLPDDIETLATIVRDTNPTLLVIDPISSHLASHVDSHRDANLRSAIDPIAALAVETGVTVVVVAHLNKVTSGDLYVRLSGSVGFFNAARSVLLFANDPEADDDDTSARVLIHGKCNVGPLAPTMMMRLESAKVPTVDGPAETSRLSAVGESNVSAQDALTPVSDEDRSKADRAADWLAHRLSDGAWWPVADIKADAEENLKGINYKTLQRASNKLGVEKDKPDMETGWQWRLPITMPRLAS